ncbi:MAG: endopeptidase La [bacterium]|nr:endopeptidase La [bacterium]
MSQAESPEELLPVIPLRDMVVLPHMVVSLQIGRARSVAALEAALASDRRLVLISQRQAHREEPEPRDLHDTGVRADVIQILRQPDATMRVLLEAKERLRLVEMVETEPALQGRFVPLTGADETTDEHEPLRRLVTDQIEEILTLDPKLLGDKSLPVETGGNPGRLADLAIAYLVPDLAIRQEMLETPSVGRRLERLAEVLGKLVEELRVDHEIHQRVRSRIEGVQREVYLREKLRQVQAELSDQGAGLDEETRFRQAVERAGLPTEAREVALREVERLSQAGRYSPEGGVIRGYLETLIELPWKKRTRDRLDLAAARHLLDGAHHGLDRVKERLIEFLAVRELTRKPPTTILCLVGPPGVGKTSLARSIARALGRKFISVSLGGIQDEAEIRGHRRTYVGALPGRLIQSLRQSGSRNPVILLDEIDKIGRQARGNPASALLEVLDPEQHRTFRDHYLEVPFDLSEVLFLATANHLQGIPPALLDRLEIVRIPGYTEPEKLAIAREHLVPRTRSSHGLDDDALNLDEPLLREIVRGWTREAGVRQLERRISTLARKVARALVERQAPPRFEAADLTTWLGPRSVRTPEHHREPEIGTVHGLAWTEHGGSLMTLEVACLKGRGHLALTGQLGDVMKESAQAAYTAVKAHAGKLGLDEHAWRGHDVHLHVPQGAIPKDGPSAGLAIAAAIASVLTGRAVRADVAVTGEITIRGRVLAVGGIKEKVLAAHQRNLATVLLPADNSGDLEELPQGVRESLAIHAVTDLATALEHLLMPLPESPAGEPPVVPQDGPP